MRRQQNHGLGYLLLLRINYRRHRPKCFLYFPGLSGCRLSFHSSRTGNNQHYIQTPYCADENSYEIKNLCCCLKPAVAQALPGCSWTESTKSDDTDAMICGGKEVTTDGTKCGDEPQNNNRKACCCSTLNITASPESSLINPLANLQVKIPGLSTSSAAACVTEGGGTKLFLALAQYLYQGYF